MFFPSSGHFNIANAEMKNGEFKMEIKPIDTSEELLEDNKDNRKHGTLSRNRQKVIQRKNNQNTRSLWYDDTVWDKEDEYKVGQSTTLPIQGFKLKKSFSMDSLLKINVRKTSKSMLTKEMISSPMWPRKMTNRGDQGETMNADVDNITKENFAREINDTNTKSNHSQKKSVLTGTHIHDFDNQKVSQKIKKKTAMSKGIISSPMFPRKLSDPLNEHNDISGKFSAIEKILEENIVGSVDETTFNNSESSGFLKKMNLTQATNILVDINPKNIEVNPTKSKNDSALKYEDYLSICPITNFSHNIEANEAGSLIQTSEQDTPNLSGYSGENKTDISLNSSHNYVALLKEKKENPIDRQHEHLISKKPTVERRKKRNILKTDISSPSLPRKIFENGDEVSLEQINEAELSNLLEMKFLSKSADALIEKYPGDVLKTLQLNTDDSAPSYSNPKFPTTEHEIDEEVQIRTKPTIKLYRDSKTLNYDLGRKLSSKVQDFDIRGCIKIQLPNENTQIKLKKNEMIKYQNGHLYKSNERFEKELLRQDLVISVVKLVNKREVELIDVKNLLYLLTFDSAKDAKHFMENEKISKFIDSENKSTITKTLLRLLGKRSSREVLEKKGIYQNEPIFGNTLRNIFNLENGLPKFILKAMELIERPENITSLGLYRTSGNLATIQKIRFEVDKGRLEILDEYAKDADVLTGSLKLFFRELKEPLLSCHICDKLLNITKINKKYCKKDRDKIRSIINQLPESNSETLRVLVRHLSEVVKFRNENKMDTYNLAVCWGPTIIFATDSPSNENVKDLVTQSTEATSLFDSLLTFYIDNPEELDFGRKKQDRLDANRNTIQRQDSKDSIQSSDSNSSKGQKKSSSNLNLHIDEVLKKFTDLIEMNISREGLYKKSGSSEKVFKIMKKLTKKKIIELDKYKYDVNELTDSFKKYLKDVHEPVATKESVEQINKLCENTPCLDPNTRQKVMTVVNDLPRKDTLIFLINHILKVMEHEPSHGVKKSEMIFIWTDTLNYQRRIIDSDEKFSTFLKILLDVLDETKLDYIVNAQSLPNGLLNDLKAIQRDKDRISKYDNVPEETTFHKEATILEEKTDIENTKL